MVATRQRRCGICREHGHNARTCDRRNQQVQAQPEPQQQTSESVLTESGKEDLGVLSLGGRQVFVSLLPSQAASVMVKYQPDVQVSCVIPPQTFNVSYSARRAVKKIKKIVTPTLIMSCGYGEVPNTQNYLRLQRGYTLWSYDTTRTHRIYAKPYIFANVYQDGRICFGGLKPRSLRQAYNQYWSSSFNNDLYRERHNCERKVHTYAYHNGCECDPSYKQHACECDRTTFHRHRGCGCTTVVESKKCRGMCGSEFSNSCDCCQAINEAYRAAREQDLSISVRKLHKLSVTDGEPYPGCGCVYRHKRGCRCGKNLCNCNCLCPCCQGTCAHGTCECSCCLNACNCRCNCTMDQQFAYHIDNYHEKLMPKQKWVDRTNLFCGTKFWASPVGATGVLVCNERLLLNQVPRKYWRKDANGLPMVVATAHVKDHVWHFESGGFVFTLRENNVVTK